MTLCLDVDAWRLNLYLRDPLPVPRQRQFLAEVELLRSALARQRIDFAKKADRALEKRLGEVATNYYGGCPTCRDAEARAVLAKLKRIVEG